MFKKLILLSFLLVPTVASTQETNTIYPRSGVLLTRFPQAVGSPNYSGTITNPFLTDTSNNSAKFTFWRETIDGESRLFIEVKPISKYFSVCGSNYSVIQSNGKDYGASFNITRQSSRSVCEILSAPEIFLVDQNGRGEARFTENNAFTFRNTDSRYSGSIDVAAADGSNLQSSISGTTDEFNLSSGELVLPNVKVGNENYSAILKLEGNGLFSLKSATKK